MRGLRTHPRASGRFRAARGAQTRSCSAGRARPPTVGVRSSATGSKCPPTGSPGGPSSQPTRAARRRPTCTAASLPAPRGSTASRRSTPWDAGATRTWPAARPTRGVPRSRWACARGRTDRGASQSAGPRRPATTVRGSPGTASGHAARTTATGSRSPATRVRRRPPTPTATSGRTPTTATRWRRSTPWARAPGRSRRARARTPMCPPRR